MTFTIEEIDQYIKMADQAIQNKEFDQAITTLNTIIQKNPNYAPSYMSIGSILMHSKSPEKALGYIKKSLELKPDNAEGWRTLGHYHKNRKEWAESIKAFEQTLHLTQENREIQYEILQLHRRLSNYQQAFTIAEKLWQLDRDNTLYLWRYAQLLNDTGREDEALTEYNLLIKTERGSIPIEAIEEWYELVRKTGLIKEARNHLKILSEKNPKSAILKLLYGFSCEDDLDNAGAYSAFKDAYRLDPQNIKVIHALAYILNIMGNSKEAQKYNLEVVMQNPLATDTLRTMGDRHHYAYGDPYFQRLNFAAAYLPQMNDRGRIHLHYALGKAYDDVGELKIAFEHYKMGGKLHRQKRPGKSFDIHNLKKLFEKTIDEKFIHHYQHQGSSSKKPVFIMGMPRSGTTLIEQVLSGLDGVYGAGELVYINQAMKGVLVGNKKINPKGFNPFPENSDISYHDRALYYLQQLEADAPIGSSRIIDKMPTNFMFLGLIHLLFPQASIIHSRRHPVETCLSAYRLLFSGGHYWSDDLREMGKYYRDYTELMRHWKSVLPEGTILDVRYEDMVADVEGQSKRLAAYIGIEWDASCLKFYETKRAVRTASLSQVRQPIYTTSINRWHRYEPYLSPLLDEIGDIVKAYEEKI